MQAPYMSIYLLRVEAIMVLHGLMHTLIYRPLLMLQPPVMKFGLQQVHIIPRVIRLHRPLLLVQLYLPEITAFILTDLREYMVDLVAMKQV